MESNLHLTGYDLVVLGFFALFIIRGIWLGLLKQVTGLVALCLGYYVASGYHDRLFPFLRDVSDNPKVVFIASVVILFVATYIVAMLIGRALTFVMEITLSRWFDRGLGAALGVVKAAVVVVLVHMVFSSLLPPENRLLRDCRTCSYLEDATDFAREFIRDEEVRKALMQKTPAISVDDVRAFLESGGDKGQTAPQDAPEGPDHPPSSAPVQ